MIQRRPRTSSPSPSVSQASDSGEKERPPIMLREDPGPTFRSMVQLLSAVNSDSPRVKKKLEKFVLLFFYCFFCVGCRIACSIRQSILSEPGRRRRKKKRRKRKKPIEALQCIHEDREESEEMNPSFLMIMREMKVIRSHFLHLDRLSNENRLLMGRRLF